MSVLYFKCVGANSNESNCISCTRLFVDDASDFVSSIRYHFTSIFPSNNVFNKDLELFFTKANLRHFSLNVLFHSGNHYMLVDSKQNKCLYFLVAKQPCDRGHERTKNKSTSEKKSRNYKIIPTPCPPSNTLL